MGENTGWLEVVHTGGGPMAIEINVFERELTLDGELKRDSLKKSNDFTMHPTEIILYPNERRRVQVIYRGKKPAADKAYLLVSREVPLRLDDDDGGGVRMGVSMLMAYQTVISLETGRRGSLTFVSSKAIEDGNIELIVENKSPGRVAVDRLVITAAGERVTEFTGRKNSIMPGQQRRFTFPFSKPLTAREVSFGNR
jgi:P pilus assembly chaperone PapD